LPVYPTATPDTGGIRLLVKYPAAEKNLSVYLPPGTGGRQDKVASVKIWPFLWMDHEIR